VIAALAVNAIPLTETQLSLLLDYLDGADGTGPVAVYDDDGPARRIPEDRFVSGMYALSWQHRDAGDASMYAVFPDSDFTTETATGWFKTKRMLWAVSGRGREVVVCALASRSVATAAQLFDDPSSSATAAAIAYLMTGIIILSVAAFIAQTYRPVREGHEQDFTAIEVRGMCVGGLVGSRLLRAPSLAVPVQVFCVVAFTIEYGIRLLCTPQPRAFVTSFFNAVDLASIVPYYLELMIAGLVGSGAPLLRALRLIRVFRLMKIGRYVAWMRVFGRTMEASLRPLAMLAFVTGTMIVFWSTFAYFLERGQWDGERGMWVNDQGQPSFFSSIPASFWWAIVSMSTGASRLQGRGGVCAT